MSLGDNPIKLNKLIKMQNFNKIAQKIGCKARIKGKKNVSFYECIGESKGFEIIVKIDMKRFSILINKYPELH